jgi:hypothetical protein
MKERLQQLLSEVGENIEYIRSDIRNLSRYLALNATLTTQTDRAKRRKLLRSTQKVVGPPPEKQPEPDSERAKSVHFFSKLSSQTLWQPPPR